MKRLKDMFGPKESEVMNQKMKMLREKMGFLIARETNVNTEIGNDEIHLGRIRIKEVAEWLRTVGDKKAELHSIEKEIQQGLSNSQLISRIEILTSDVQRLLQQGAFPNALVLDDYKSRSMQFPVTDLVGGMFRQNIEIIRKWLENPQVSLIGVCGMGGVGKTTLLKHTYNHLWENSDINWHLYWVTVSQDCSLYKLQQKIFHAITGKKDLDEEDEVMRATTLHNMLEKRNIVLILDDIWKDFDLNKVGISGKYTNFKIIMSSCSKEVCQQMGCEFVVEVQTLAENEAWQLFANCLLNYQELASEAKQIAPLVAQQCGRLPLAIVTVASSLRGVTDFHEWKNALNDLNDPNGGHMKDIVFSRLKFSYDRLKDELHKSCFLSCVLYPEDAEIPRRLLIEMWINEGLLDGMQNREKQQSKGHSILNKLVSSCLLQATTGYWTECVKMHVLIREMGIIISRPHFMAKPGLLLKEVPEEKFWTEDLLKVSLLENQIKEIPCGMSPRCSKLTVLMLCSNPLKGIPESFFVHLTRLTILDLSHTNIQRLPESVSNLENLRALDLGDCFELIYVPSLAKLMKLRVLNLDGCDKLVVPKGLEKLKHPEKLLKCQWDVSDLTYYNRVIESSWHSLQTYQFRLSKDPTNSELFDLDWSHNQVVMSDVVFGPEERTTLLIPSTVQVLELYDFDGTASNLDGVFPYLYSSTELKDLKIEQWRGLGYILSAQQQDSSICGPLDTIEELELEDLPDLQGLIQFGWRFEAETVLPSPSSQPPSNGGQFPHLKRLTISKCPKIKVVFPDMFIDEHLSLLPNLETIKVSDCAELEEILEVVPKLVSTTYGAMFPHLQWLIISKCPKIKVLFPAMFMSEHLPLLPNLVTIKVSDCAELEKILEAVPKLVSTTYGGLFPHLKGLTISKCPKIKVVFPAMFMSEHLPLLPNLVTIKVTDCAELEEILEAVPKQVSTTYGAMFPHLKLLTISKCPKIKVVFPDMFIGEHLRIITIDDCPKLQRLPQLESVICDASPSTLAPIVSYTNLRELLLKRCDKIKEVFSPKLLQQQQSILPSLLYLHVESCKDVEVIFASPISGISPIISLPNLQKLTLKRLPKLGRIYKGVLLISVSAKNMKIKDCPKLQRLPQSESVTCDASPSTLAPIMSYTNLRDLLFQGCDEIKEVFPLKLLQQQQPILPNLLYLRVEGCKDVEVIFASPISGFSPIISLPNLRKLTFKRLPKLGCIYKGVVLISSAEEITIADCPRLPRLSQSETVICDASPSALLSIQTYMNDPQWWEPFSQLYPQDALELSEFLALSLRPRFLNKQRPQEDRKPKRKWDSFLTLSLPSDISDEEIGAMDMEN